MKLFIGADHRGHTLKEALKPWLTSLGHEVTDCGNSTVDPNDDYPDFAFAVTDRVSQEPKSFGIVICGSSVGVTVAANKAKGIRCSAGVATEEIRKGREDDDTNVLALSGDFTTEAEAKEKVTAFINTPFKGEERHIRRLKKIEARECC